MSQPEALAGFVAKWRARWPEWTIAQVFVTNGQREVAVTWFALLQELTDAAWGGSDPTPGLAKLAWWQEELRGWSKGARRHPLGDTLQRLPASWDGLADTLMTLQQGRARPVDAQAAMAASRSFAEAVAQCEATLFGPSDDATALIGRVQLAERLLSDPEGSVPLKPVESREVSLSPARDWASELLIDWPRSATRPRRLQAALVRARLEHFADGGDNTPLTPWRTLILAWRAARER